jgi:hypothetical protein
MIDLSVLSMGSRTKTRLAELGFRTFWKDDRDGWAHARDVVFAACKRAGMKSHEGQALWDEIKRARFELRAVDWRSRIPEEDREWVHTTLAELYDKVQDPCVDNVCVEDMGRPSGVRRFKRSTENGCCGRYETTRVSPSGRTYRFGFNYGH